MQACRTEHREEELALALVAFRGVEGAVAVEEGGEVFHVDRASEKLEAVLRVKRDLAVVDHGSGADAREGDAVDRAICAAVERSQDSAAMPDTHVAQNTRRVCRV